MATGQSRGEEGRLASVSGAIVLGGASSRMGRDKARLELAGTPLATRLALLLGRLFEEVLLVGGDPPPGAPGRRVADMPGPRCALRGLVTALSRASGEHVLVLATDLPLVTPDLVLALTAWPGHDAVVPRLDGRPHPLCAIYRREPVLEVARTRLEAGELRLGELLEALDTGYLEGADLGAVDPEGIALSNVNTERDWARVETWFAESGDPGCWHPVRLK